MTLHPLSGPSVPTASGNPARQLVVFLHGVGSDGDDLIALAPYFARWLPDAAFLAPHAPLPFDMAPVGRQWFSLQNLDSQAISEGVASAAPSLDRYLDEQLAAHGLTDGDLALVGFSQGTMMALHVALRRHTPCAAVVGYSGLLAAPERLPAEATARPPILLVHGEEDEVVPHDFLALAEKTLSVVGIPVDTLSCPGLGHSINDDGLMAGMQFVTQAFGLAFPPETP
ncbi:alpha/beta hydrolase [Telmatospirillum siberiense]|uniref:Phospholipase n=1 Tax=Telmatospirillum siberiense TaxID=382514 RepID=A0A2N3PQU9_9PROT|nr:dienelactone hydrolase family protein [Telmatospirillum siberiense]PKU22780.1 phospholipase [Telmatospirillum siberiense]